MALAGTGLLTTVGVIVAMDTFGPISDNAQGIAEMSGDIDEDGARILTDLDAVGNTTKAITKGIAIATAVLAATALFGSYTDTAADCRRRRRGRARRQRARPAVHRLLNVSNPKNLVGLLIGAAVVFLFSGLAINAVSRVGRRRGVRGAPAVPRAPRDHGRHRAPEYGKVVDICTRDAQRELITPGLLAILAPIAVGFGLGAGALGVVPGRRDRRRHADGGLPGQLRWRLGQREEDGRGRRVRRQGLRRRTPRPSSATPSVTRSRTPPARPSTRCIKVMNLVSLLIAPAVVALSIGDDANTALRVVVALVAVAVIAGAVYWSKRRSIAVAEEKVEAGVAQV